MNRNVFIRTTAVITSLFLVAGCGNFGTRAEDAVNEQFAVISEEAVESAETVVDIEMVSDEETAEEYVFTDALGREVTVKETEKVAVLLGSFCDIWMLAGGEVNAVVMWHFWLEESERQDLYSLRYRYR